MYLTCPRNSLTNFEFEAHVITGNGSYVNLLKLEFSNMWKSFMCSFIVELFVGLESVP